MKKPLAIAWGLIVGERLCQNIIVCVPVNVEPDGGHVPCSTSSLHELGDVYRSACCSPFGFWNVAVRTAALRVSTT